MSETAENKGVQGMNKADNTATPKTGATRYVVVRLDEPETSTTAAQRDVATGFFDSETAALEWARAYRPDSRWGALVFYEADTADQLEDALKALGTREHSALASDPLTDRQVDAVADVVRRLAKNAPWVLGVAQDDEEDCDAAEPPSERAAGRHE